MLDIETLRRKREIIVRGEKIVDLTPAVIEYKDTPVIDRSVIVESDVVMRPDIIARIVYGNANRLDYLMKFNDFSNPFAIDEGDIFLVPDENHMREQFIDPRVEEETEDLRNELLDPNKLNRKDQNRLDYLKQKALDAKATAPSATPLPPVFAEPGTDEIEVKDGKLIFGGNVVASLEDCPEPLSRASIKAKLLANKIFREGQ